MAAVIKTMNHIISFSLILIILSSSFTNLPSFDTATASEDIIFFDDSLIVDERWMDVIQNGDENSLTVKENIWFNNTTDRFFQDALCVWVPDNAEIIEMSQVIGEEPSNDIRFDLEYENNLNLICAEPTFGMANYGTTGAFPIEVSLTSHDYEGSASAVATTYVGGKFSRFGVLLKTDEPSKEVNIGSSITIKIELENTGNEKDSFDLKYDDPELNWTIDLSVDRIEVNAYETQSFELTVTPPADLEIGKNISLELSAVSQNDNKVMDTLYFFIEVVEELPDLVPLSVKFTNESVNVTLANNGSADANDIHVSFNVDNVTIQNKTIAMLENSNTESLVFSWSYEDNRTVLFQIDPDNAIKELNETNNELVIVTNQSMSNGSRSLERTSRNALLSTRDVKQPIEIEIAENESSIELGWEIIYSMKITNNNPATDNILLSAGEIPEGWFVRFIDENNEFLNAVLVNSGDSVDIGLVVRVPWYKIHIYLEYDLKLDPTVDNNLGTEKIAFEKQFLYPTTNLDSVILILSGTEITYANDDKLSAEGKKELSDGRQREYYSLKDENIEQYSTMQFELEWEHEEPDETGSFNNFYLYIILFIIISMVIGLFFMRKSDSEGPDGKEIDKEKKDEVDRSTKKKKKSMVEKSGSEKTK